jgi:uncharacterized protein (TIGR02678 family)
MTVRPVERPAPTQDPIEAAERVEAARALLLHPLISADGQHAAALRLVRRHQGELTRVFSDGAGYRLQVDPSGARLFKTGLGRDATRPLRRRSGSPFTPRAYALLCLTVAALTRCRAQLLIDELVQQVRSAAVDAGIDVDLDASADRRALHAALLALVNLGVLRERDGDLEHWADQRTQSLLDVRRDLLSLLVAAPLGSAESADELLRQASLPSAVGGARMAVRRRLLESPVLTVADLTEEQAEWWRRNRNRETEWFRDRFGLEVELRAEGALAIDPSDELTDEQFPGRGGTRHLALLALEALADEARSGARAGDPWHGIPLPARTRGAAPSSRSGAESCDGTSARTPLPRSSRRSPCWSRWVSSGGGLGRTATPSPPCGCTPRRPATHPSQRSSRARRPASAPCST